MGRRDDRSQGADRGARPEGREGDAVIYTAIEGRSAGLPVYDSIFLLGRESALRRLRAARAKL